MTAVDYLEREFKDKLIGENIPEWVQDIFNLAKAMEREQIINAYETSHISMMTSEQYYNEAFNQNNNQ